ncbi:MAG: patatin-like phospholipase family protein [Pseudomonadota bacterium]
MYGRVRYRDWGRSAVPWSRPGSRALLLVLVVGVLAACASVERRPVPADHSEIAQIPGIPDARHWGDAPRPGLEDYLLTMREQRLSSGGPDRVVLLALSGGADDGAFGAGLLKAWSDAGDRPEFQLVTGVSTGGLSAPFAFLGPDYDADLKEVFSLPADRIFSERAWVNILPKASAMDTLPLFEVISSYADEALLEAVAAEAAKGRRLFVQSTNLDAQRPVIWDLTAIASSGAPEALDVFRKALLASASIPGAFPPVTFEVEADGESYDEIHADGGVISQDTVMASWLFRLDEIAAQVPDVERAPLDIYVVRNGRVAPQHEGVQYDLITVVGRAASTMIKMSGLTDIYVGYLAAEAADANFYATWIGDDFTVPYSGPFDVDYMAALYDYGEKKLESGKAWSPLPPFLPSHVRATEP